MNFVIQPASPGYASLLTEIALSAKRHWNYPERWIELWIPALTITEEYLATHETWMALIGEKPAAWYSFNKNEEGMWLDNLWVLPESMGQGFGRELFLHALERCRSQDIKTLKIEADPNAQSFYEKMGARKVGEHRGEVEGQPRILPVMEIHL